VAHLRLELTRTTVRAGASEVSARSPANHMVRYLRLGITRDFPWLTTVFAP
jgi:hypothetical protein